MSNQSPESSFPASREDVSKLKQSATDAASDLGQSASGHGEKIKGQVQDLAHDVTKEASAQVEQAKAQFSDVLNSAREYAVARPFAVVGVAFLVGFFLGQRRCDSQCEV